MQISLLPGWVFVVRRCLFLLFLTSILHLRLLSLFRVKLNGLIGDRSRSTVIKDPLISSSTLNFTSILLSS